MLDLKQLGIFELTSFPSTLSLSALIYQTLFALHVRPLDAYIVWESNFLLSCRSPITSNIIVSMSCSSISGTVVGNILALQRIYIWHNIKNCLLLKQSTIIFCTDKLSLPQTELASSGPWENVMLTNIHTHHRWHQCSKIVPKFGGKLGGVGTPWGRKDHTYQCDGICMCPTMCAMGTVGGGPWMGSDGSG